MKYVVVVECGPGDACGAYAPDLPGVVLAVGRSREEVLDRMDTAIEMHLEALVRHGVDVPPAVTESTHLVEGSHTRFRVHPIRADASGARFFRIGEGTMTRNVAAMCLWP
jgi:predicted RNase H-like HicB family nuclease